MNEVALPPVIDASPTKDFFISMLVKDIELVPAIIDLVDNSVDGMRRVRAQGYTEPLWIRLQMSSDEFRIQDNCGGIPAVIAQDYAFRFGRPANTPPTAHSVGQFGVGMKRALFKLGGRFTVTSRSAHDRFGVDVDVDDWRNRPPDEPWQFQFAMLERDLPEAPISERGTTIIVTRLHENVASDIGSETFRARLGADLQRQHQMSLEDGLAISVNGVPLDSSVVEFLQSDELRAAHTELSLSSGGPQVTVKIYAGLARSDPREAGWYIFCNGRLVVAGDRTPLTGWEWGRTIPKYHNQFSRFRGYAFFDSDDASRLPWTTTKKGVDENSAVFRAARLKMVELMRPVIDFLNILDKESEGRPAGDMGPLGEALLRSTAVPVTAAIVGPVFVGPQAPVGPRPPRTGRIQYDRPVEEIDKIKRALKVNTYKDVGERTFVYYMRMEVDE